MVRYFHIEGMDLAGKSTATKAVFEALEGKAVVRHNTLQQKSKFHKIVDDLRLSQKLDNESLGQLYFQVLKDDLSRFSYPEIDTIQDSTILLRSLSWHMARKNEDLSEQFLGLIPQHPQFTGSVLLTATIEVRQKRLQYRIEEDPLSVAIDDLMVINEPDLFMKMGENLVHYTTKFFGTRVIDTSSLTKQEVAQQVLSILNV